MQELWSFIVRTCAHTCIYSLRVYRLLIGVGKLPPHNGKVPVIPETKKQQHQHLFTWLRKQNTLKYIYIYICLICQEGGNTDINYSYEEKDDSSKT